MPLHYGKVPRFLSERMGKMGDAIIESIVDNYGKSEVLTRMSDPNWFQAFGAVTGMHWNSSGVTAVLMGALRGTSAAKAQLHGGCPWRGRQAGPQNERVIATGPRIPWCGRGAGQHAAAEGIARLLIARASIWLISVKAEAAERERARRDIWR